MRIRDHVLPVLGEMPIVDISACHVVELFKRLRTGKRQYAPRTIYNIYANLKAVFRDAQMADLIDATDPEGGVARRGRFVSRTIVFRGGDDSASKSLSV